MTSFIRSNNGLEHGSSPNVQFRWNRYVLIVCVCVCDFKREGFKMNVSFKNTNPSIILMMLKNKREHFSIIFVTHIHLSFLLRVLTRLDLFWLMNWLYPAPKYWNQRKSISNWQRISIQYKFLSHLSFSPSLCICLPFFPFTSRSSVLRYYPSSFGPSELCMNVKNIRLQTFFFNKIYIFYMVVITENLVEIFEQRTTVISFSGFIYRWE